MKTIALIILGLFILNVPAGAEELTTLFRVVNSSPVTIRVKVNGSPHADAIAEIPVGPQSQAEESMLWTEANTFSTHSLIEATVSSQSTADSSGAYCQLLTRVMGNGLPSKQLYAIIKITAPTPGTLSCTITGYRKQ